MKNNEKIDEYQAALDGAILKQNRHERPEQVADNALWAITTIAESRLYGGTRSPAIYTSFEQARDAIETNLGDIFETTYCLALIEPIIPNCLYGSHGPVLWYMWVGDYETGGYQAIEEPPGYKDTAGYSIG